MSVPILILAPAAGAQAVEPLRAELARSAEVVVYEPRGTSTRAMARAAAARVERAHVYGISLGGMAAAWLAADFPDVVQRLVLASCVPRVRARTMARALVFGPPLFARVDVHWRRVPSLLVAAARHDASSAIERVRAPVLVLAGERDGLFPPDEQLRAWSGLRDMRFKVVAGAAHAMSLDRPAEVAKLLREFFYGESAAADAPV